MFNNDAYWTNRQDATRFARTIKGPQISKAVVLNDGRISIHWKGKQPVTHVTHGMVDIHFRNKYVEAA